MGTGTPESPLPVTHTLKSLSYIITNIFPKSIRTTLPDKIFLVSSFLRV